MSRFTRTFRSLGFALAASSTALVACGGGGGDSIVGPPGGGGKAVATITLSPSTASIVVGGTTTLSAALADASGNALSGRTVTWTSSDASIASTSDAGVVTGKAVGSATITATSEGKTAQSTITVTDPVATLTLSPATAGLVIGGTTTLSAALADAAGNALSGRTIVWTSSDANVATISDVGVVTAKAVGTATISATSEGITGKATITVSDPVAAVTVTPGTVALTYFDTTTVAVTTFDAAGTAVTGRTVTWSSSDTTVATVSSTGHVSAVGVGTATVSATSEGKVGQTTITVTKAPVAQIVASPTTMTVKVGATQSFTISLLDASGNKLYGRRIAIQLSNSTVATVSQSGQSYPVTGTAAGSVTLTISAESAPTATVTVTVTP
ncbi:MAG TPA: Ig-like domain-containing protein [Gemmatimonadaceae bacterium]